MVSELRHVLRPDSLDRESLVWVAPCPDLGLTVVLYTWVDSSSVAGTAAMAFGPAVGDQLFVVNDGIPVAPHLTFEAWQVGELAVSLGDGGASSVVYNSTDLSAAINFEGTHTPYAYSSHADGCPAFFADDRVEQTGRMHGTLRVRGKTYEIDCLGQRDHSWGTRDWAAMTHMKWLNVMATPGLALHLVEIQAFGANYLRGYLLKDGITSELDSVQIRYVYDGRLCYRSISGHVLDALGRTATLELVADPLAFVWQVHPRLRLHDSMMAGTLEGTSASAYVDASWANDYLDFHQARQYDEIRA